MFAARGVMARGAIAGTRQIFAAHQIGSREIGGNASRIWAMIIGEDDRLPPANW